MNPLALIDACVLVPEWLRDLLLRTAEAGLFRLRWSEEILGEMERALVRDLKVPSDKAARVRTLMAQAFDDALVTDFEPLIDSMTNDPKDRHVLAAAAHAAVSESEEVVLVTANLRHFPANALPPAVVVRSPDQFLCDLIDDQENLAMMVDVVWAHAQRRKRPPVAVSELLDGLAHSVPQFVERLRKVIDVRTKTQLDAIAERLVRAHGHPTAEFLVALKDYALVDANFNRTVTESVRRDRVRIASTFLRALNDANQAVADGMWSLLSDRGITLPREVVARMSPEEFDQLMEAAGQSRS